MRVAVQIRAKGRMVVGYLFGAYAVIWTALFLYLVGLRRRQDRLAEEVERLRAALGAEPSSE